MPRHTFGGSPSDYAMERVGNQLLVRPGATGTVWNALTGGSQYTDLTDLTGNPVTQVTADADGAVAFMGPNDVTSLYVDFGYTRRFALTAVDLGETLTDFIAQGGEPGGWAQLDGSGNIDGSQIPAQLDWIVASNHGAVGDGAHDDTMAIQAAIDACQPGGIVYLPRGVYKTTATLDLKNGVSLVGSHANMMVGPGMTGEDYPCYIQPATPFTGTSVIQIIGEDDGEHPAISGEQRLTNLMLDGSQLTGTSIDGVFAKGNVQNVVMENFTVRQMPNNGMVTGDVGGVYPYSWRLRHVMIDNCHANGILFTGNTDLTLDDVQVIGCYAQGIVLTNITNGQLLGCRTEWNGSHGYRITGAWGDWAGSGGMQITGCSTDRNGGHGLLVDATGNTPILISGMMTRRDGRNGGTGGGNYAGLAVVGATVPVTVHGVTCYPGVDDGGASTNSPQYGVRLSGASSVMLDDAYLHAQTAGFYDDGTNTAVSVGPNIMTVAGATTVAVRTVDNRYRAHPAARYVAASTAPAREKSRADWVCDGTADDVQIQAAIDAVKAAGGGEVFLSQGTFNLAAQLRLEGSDDVDVEVDITVRGAGKRSTTLAVGSGLASGMHLTKVIRAKLEDFGLTVAGASHGISSDSTHSGTSGHRSFWHSTFRNLQVNGPFNGTHTGWGLHLGSPFRSVFENIELAGIGNGMRMFSENAAFNPGDCQATRMFVDTSGNNRVAYQVESTTAEGVMNQIEFSMCEAINSGTGSTGILISGTGPVSHCHFRGINLEQFDKLVDVQRGHGNTFRLNYVELRAANALTAVTFGANAYNNSVLSLGALYSANTHVLYADGNTSIPNQPNRIENVRIYADTGAVISGTANTSGTTVRRGIVGSGPGTISVLVPHGANIPTSIITLTDAATIATNASYGSHFRVSMAGNRTLGVPTLPTDGQRGLWEVTASGGARTLTLAGGAGGFAFGSDITALSATVSGKTDYIGAVYNASANVWRVIAYVKGY